MRRSWRANGLVLIATLTIGCGGSGNSPVPAPEGGVNDSPVSLQGADEKREKRVIADDIDPKDLEKSEKVNTLRNVIVNAQIGDSKNRHQVSGAFKELFTYLGLEGLKELTRDEDTSIALQAAWETHKKPVKRDPAIAGRTDWVFDEKSMLEFLDFFADRVQAEPPEWWRDTLIHGEVFPGDHHAFVYFNRNLPPAVKVEVENDEVLITAGLDSIELSKAAYNRTVAIRAKAEARAEHWGNELSFFAPPSGYPFETIGVETQTGKKLWTASVWAANEPRPMAGRPWPVAVDIRRQGDMVIVYGYAFFGMFAEGFDVKTGECQFRFCTCYWSQYSSSEKWGLK